MNRSSNVVEIPFGSGRYVRWHQRAADSSVNGSKEFTVWAAFERGDRQCLARPVWSAMKKASNLPASSFVNQPLDVRKN